MSNKLKDKIALITGGTEGIGFLVGSLLQHCSEWKAQLCVPIGGFMK
jgi:hypothetical protein